MTLVQWNPFSEMNRLFNENILRSNGEDILTGNWAPRVDIFENEDAIEVSVALPGLKQQDVKVNIENNVLTISGERKFEHDEKKENYSKVEQYYGTFSRSFSLSNTIDPEKVNASMEQGILKVLLPKREETKPKQIEVKVK